MQEDDRLCIYNARASYSWCSSSGVGSVDEMFRLCLCPEMGDEAVEVRCVYAGEWSASVEIDGGRECSNDHRLGSVSPSVVLDVVL